MIGILLVSHGCFAKGIRDSLNMFFGDDELKQIDTLSLCLDDNASEFGKMIDKKIQQLDTGDGVIILADMMGGTPCNQSLMKMNERVHVITGANMPMAMELIDQRLCKDVNLEELVSMVKDSIVDAGKMLNEEQSPAVDDD